MSSPLKHFTNAKKKITNLFSDISQYIEEFGIFLDDATNTDEDQLVNAVSLRHQCNST